MWYEIIPSLAIVGVCLMVPPVASAGLNWIFLNGKTVGRRWVEHPEDYHSYMRDRRITGSEYVHKGLESLQRK